MMHKPGWLILGENIRFHVLDEELRLHAVEIGRHPSLVSLVLDDATVSRRHLRIFRASGGIYAEDLHARNGTFINGKRLAPFEPFILPRKAEILVGYTSLQWQHSA